MKKIFVVIAIMFCTQWMIAQNNVAVEKRATYLTDWLTDLLNLETQQKAKVFTVYQSYLNNMANMLDTYREDITKLRNQKDALEVEQQQSIRAILNKVQLEKYTHIISTRTQ